MTATARAHSLLAGASILLGACRTGAGEIAESPELARSDAAAEGVAWDARGERVDDFAALVPKAPVRREVPGVRLERITTAVPWPRGVEWVDGELVVLARGRHRNAGGVDASIPDTPGCLYRVDPGIAEPIVPGQRASLAVQSNATTLARAQDSPFHLYDGSVEPIEDTLMDRPYCTLIYDAPSKNFFICGFSGVDLPQRRFRKNASDSIHRFDLRDREWHPVEMHDGRVVPEAELGYVVSNAHYPHHDPATNAPPHGWLNGPDGGCVAGRYLYCVSKDNHRVVQYDLAGIRSDPSAGPPASRPVLGPRVRVRHPGGEREMEVLGPSAVAVHGGYMYVGYRTSSVVLRFPLGAEGELLVDGGGELIAVFEPWSAETERSANLIDIAFDSQGELYVSCAEEGGIWKVGRPDPARPFYGDDASERATSAPLYVDLAAHTGEKTGCGNITFDDQDRLYICVGNYDSDDARIAGAIYRATPLSAE